MDILRTLRRYVRYNDLVKNMDLDIIRRSINSQLSAMQTDLATNDFDIDNIKSVINGKHLEILKILEDIDDNLNTFKQGLQQTVEELAIPYYAKSEIAYKQHLEMHPKDRRLRLRANNLLHNDKTKQVLFDTIDTYISSQYAALQISPGYGDVTEHILAGTPLYIADDDEEVLTHFTGEFFNETMQRRTLFYTIDDNNDNPLGELPQDQIGFCVIVDYFNFKTVAVIEKYLQSLYNVLRPGGVVIFTFNNCDYPKAIDKVDEMYYCYTTGSEMQNLCKKLGYEIIKLIARDYDELQNGISWLEIKKPGELSTIRAGQGLAQIMDL